MGSEHFWKLISTKFAPRLRARAIWTSKSLKTGRPGALLEVDIDKICTTPARESDLEVKIVKNWRCRSTFGSCGWRLGWFYGVSKLTRGWPPLWFYGISKLTDGPLSRSQRLPQAMSLELASAMLRLAPSLVLWDFKTDGWPPSRSQRLAQAQNVVGAGFSDEKLMRGWPPLWFYRISKLTDHPRSRSQRLPHAQNVVGAGFSDAAAGPFTGFMGFQNWRMAPGPDPKGFPKPKMSLELALAMLRLGPSLVSWDFKTDGWPPVPISKACPSPTCRCSWL